MSEREAGWHLDKKVPIAIIIALATQTGAFVWWAGRLDSRVEVLEKGAVITAPLTSGQGERIIRLETKLEAITDSLAEIKLILRARSTESR